MDLVESDTGSAEAPLRLARNALKTPCGARARARTAAPALGTCGGCSSRTRSCCLNQ